MKKQHGRNAKRFLPLVSVAPLPPPTLLCGCEGHQAPCWEEKTLESCRQTGWDTSSGLEITFIPSSPSDQTLLCASQLGTHRKLDSSHSFPLEVSDHRCHILFSVDLVPAVPSPGLPSFPGGAVQLGLRALSPGGERSSSQSSSHIFILFCCWSGEFNVIRALTWKLCTNFNLI